MANDPLVKRFFERGVHATGAVTVQRPAADLYAVWRSLEQLPRFIDHLERVEVTSSSRSKWTTKGPGGTSFSWEAEIINDEPNRMMAWRTVEGTQVHNAGSIRFSELPHDRGTEVHVSLEYLPPGRALGTALAKAIGADAKTQVHEGLHRFRQMMETGEIPVTNGQPAGKNSMRSDRPGEADHRQTDPELRDLAARESTS